MTTNTEGVTPKSVRAAERLQRACGLLPAGPERDSMLILVRHLVRNGWRSEDVRDFDIMLQRSVVAAKNMDDALTVLRCHLAFLDWQDVEDD